MKNSLLIPALVAVAVGVSVSLAAATEPAASGLRLPRVLSDHMVLQRDKPARVWGWAKAGDTVTVEFAGQSRTGAAAADGRWLVELQPMPASAEGRELVVRCGGDRTVLRDVLVGDVWIGSGQSNMELDLGGTSRLLNKPDECFLADYPAIRLLRMPGETSDTPQDDVTDVEWKVCTPGNVGPFSAVAYYFARDVHEATKVPIGMIASARGGTYPESWQTRGSLESLASPIIDTLLAERDKKVADWVAKPEGADPRHGEPGLQLPAGCYNHMIHPIANFAIKGALFYQGENSAVAGGDRTRAYPIAYPAVIRNWRQVFRDPALPFGIIEMAPWGGPAPLTHPNSLDHPSPFVRDVHFQTYLRWPDTGLVVTMDCGKLHDMHPWDKEPVGHRAALWALSQVYGVGDGAWTGPLYRSLEIKGGKAVIRFKRESLSLPLGMKDPAGTLDGFIIAGADRVWHEAKAAIVGDTVEVSSDNVPEPVAVRYAWEDAQGQVNLLVNADGLPASPFRTDRWATKPIFDQPLLVPAEGPRPWADAGADVTVKTVDGSVTLDGGGSYAPDGTITKYEWKQVAGPAVTTTDTTNKTLTLDKPAEGLYRFRLTVTDDRGLTAGDEVAVRVVDRSMPVAVAGPDRKVVYAVAGAELDGSRSHAILGSIKGHAWTQVAGPGQAVIADPAAAKTRVTGLVAGTYDFRLTATDSIGKQATDDVKVVVQPGPIVNGGFETGDFTGWSVGGDPLPVVQTDNAHSGRFAALVGNDTGKTGPNGNGWQGLSCSKLNRLENLPPNARLSLWVRRSGRGPMKISLREGNVWGNNNVIQDIMPSGSYADSDWVHVTADLSAHAGKTVSIWFEICGGVDNHTFMLVDDVELSFGGAAP